jgi:hypothetical protein
VRFFVYQIWWFYDGAVRVGDEDDTRGVVEGMGPKF